MNRDFHYVFVIYIALHYIYMVDACYAATMWLVWFSVTFGQPSFFSSLSISTIMAEAHQVRQDKKPPSTKAGTLPLNKYQTAVHPGERKFAGFERVQLPKVSKEEEREGAPTSRDPGGGG